MKAYIYLEHNFKVDYKKGYTVGVEKGGYQLALKNIYFDLAIGDFDSVSKDEFLLIKKYAKKVIILEKEKDDTDSEAAIKYLKTLNFNDIYLIGDIGKRLDHLMINYRLVEKYNITYLLENNKIFNLKEGKHKIKTDYQYLSFFTSDKCQLSVNNVKYSLNKANITYFDTYLSSNESLSDYVEVEVVKGNVTLILSKD